MDLDMKRIPNFPDYSATKDGKIYSHFSNIFLKPCKGGGYYKVGLSKNKKRFNKPVHRLVAQAFIPNPNNYGIINHKDNNGENNNVENLEWCTYKYNTKHAIDNGHKKVYMRSVCQISMSGEILKTYKSITEASKEARISYPTICNVCKGKNLKAGGYYWKYKENEEWKIPKSRSCKKVGQVDPKSGNVLKIFDSGKEAADFIGAQPSSICSAIKGIINILKGYKWIRIQEEEKDPLFEETRDWKIVNKYPNYRISKNGRVYSERQRIMRKLQTNKYGYKIICLCNGTSIVKTFFIHRLIAEVYIPNPKNKKYINHKNGARDDNRLENLEWCTSQENAQHAHDTGLNTAGKSIIQYNLQGEEIARYKNSAIASKITSISSYRIRDVCNKRGVTGGGYIWRKTTDPIKDKNKICIDKRFKKVVQLDDNGKIMQIFSSITDANISMGKKNRRKTSHIGAVCIGKGNKAFGYRWKYMD